MLPIFEKILFKPNGRIKSQLLGRNVLRSYVWWETELDILPSSSGHLSVLRSVSSPTLLSIFMESKEVLVHCKLIYLTYWPIDRWLNLSPDGEWGMTAGLKYFFNDLLTNIVIWSSHILFVLLCLFYVLLRSCLHLWV